MSGPFLVFVQFFQVLWVTMISSLVLVLLIFFKNDDFILE